MLEVSEVSGADGEHSDGDLEIGEDVCRDLLEFFKIVHGFFWFGDGDHLYFVELAGSEEAFFIDAVAANFFSEAHGVGCLEDREVFLVDELV